LNSEYYTKVNRAHLSTTMDFPVELVELQEQADVKGKVLT